MNKILAAAALATSLIAAPAFADGDAAEGENLFKKCKACHAVGEGAQNKVGPELNHVLGRTAGGLESFEKKYSKAMKEAGAGGLVWTPETMGEYLVAPKKYIKGTKMTFAGFKKPEDVEDMIAYLAQFSPDFVAE